ncbi:MAG: hypothetical protein DMF50_07120 [Acidobacteria bacterium]|nr:MAG: hypothetical protein DMF50_07120 [Acidobacteriota bacterium]
MPLRSRVQPAVAGCRAAALRVAALVLLAAAAAAASPEALAQQPAPRPKPATAGDRSTRRLFQRFVEDAAISSGGWVEGQYQYDNLASGSRHTIGPLIAFKVVPDLGAGLRFGFLDVRPESGPSESGLSDVDLFAKYRLPGPGHGRFALGTLLKLPTANENKGLGTGRSDLELFGAYRADLDAVTLTADAGIRLNGRTDPPFPDTKDSLLAGAGIILPATARVTFVIEGTYESERFKGATSDSRLTVGLQTFGSERRGGLRGAIAFPLSDGAPDYQVLLGAFLVY